MLMSAFMLCGCVSVNVKVCVCAGNSESILLNYKSKVKYGILQSWN